MEGLDFCVCDDCSCTIFDKGFQFSFVMIFGFDGSKFFSIFAVNDVSFHVSNLLSMKDNVNADLPKYPLQVFRTFPRMLYSSA